VYNLAYEFMFGDWLLVAPVVTGNDATGASDTKRNVYLPAGTWIDYADGKTT
jgi:alpha-glucosidase (family GH31 glycosyl hydrolase)